ncbi:hypothetical protein LOZ61_003092 [Ophidiomyces ophidiicola]|uniref:Uncharacterized protein n=1 Tax=Ophidiomyces ophidiicola TaxID=1387563 RepID=A0ACB8V3I5_9EURO|nr:hypothetical protein LOZ61_003092 [Ophidiomyces ophidiicola]KAI1930759.1 hypothetical protein LOZ60_000735 [Ophidiomyces ophidiicola]KAI1962230.1 hypothetical protein LOZ59_002060 [Ophidiomyces ophidiicola]KAI1976123.1 hypothetical protein LOZ56_000162 [Ophidiomyces ophidiicola]KAI2029405.1 hypothetical protein LOZ48_003685 [Ophidiomyces ophidiicola]
MSTFQLMIQAKLQQLREEGNAKNKSAAPDIPSTAKRPRSAEPPDIPHVPAKQAKKIEPAQAPIEQAEPVEEIVAIKAQSPEEEVPSETEAVKAKPEPAESTSVSESETPPTCTCAISNNCKLAAKNGVRDCRVLAPIPKTKRPKTTNAAPARALSTKQQARVQRTMNDMLQILNVFKQSKIRPSANLFQQMRHCVQQLPFLEIPPSSHTLLKSKFLDPNTGFPAIVNSDAVPWDIKLDIKVLQLRWEKGDLDTSLDRGLITKSAKTISRSFDPTYKFRVSCSYIGEGSLSNGQWFPWQLAASRDGAHGEIEAGVCGYPSLGAVSVILSSGYADTDEGDIIYYFGTQGKNGEASQSTTFLLQSAKNKTPLRVLRSSRLPNINKYRPVEGLRYDGLYIIESEELMDEPNMLYQFKLKRLPGQTPIRYAGPSKKPNQKEVDEYRTMQKFTSVSRKKAT